MAEEAGAVTDHDVVTRRALGCLYGVALGDAMGMPGELWPRARVRRHFGEIMGFLPGPDGHFVVDGFRAGQVTDDTQQAVMLAEVIVEAGGTVDAEAVARGLVAWADRVGASEGNFLGPSSSRAIAALRAGQPVTETGARGDTNGAAMRIAPVGVLCPSGDLPALVDAVHAASLCSHNTDIAVAGAAMVAAAVSAGIDGDAALPARERVDAALEAAVAAAELGMRRGEPVPGASLVRRARLGVELARIVEDDTAFGDDLYDLVGAGVATTESVPAALALVARVDGDPLRAALLAANLGGDTDTIGAMAGAVCGALSGIDAIPVALLDVLREVNGLDLEPLAAKLAGYRTTRRPRH